MRDAVKRSKIFLHRRRGRFDRVGRDAVQFAAIARREDDGFLENSFSPQIVGRRQRLLAAENNPLSKLDRRSAMAASDQRELHANLIDALRIGNRRH
jgi:hypothetical protein